MSIACKVRPIGGEVLLPDGYRRCEYLESTGTQWIDTGYIPNSNTSMVCIAMPLEKELVFRVLFGTRQGYLNQTFTCFSNVSSSKPSVSCRRGNLEVSWVMDYFGQITTYSITPSSATLNDSSHQWKNPYSFEKAPAPLVLGAGRSNGTIIYPFVGRIYSAKISEGTESVCNFIPCLDDKGKPCMFDTVSRTPYYNKGSGEFLYKLKTPIIRKLPRGYQPLDYLESTGTQWIDTGVKLSNDSDFKITCEFFSESEPDGNSHYAFGIGSNSIACYPLLPTRYMPHFYLNSIYVSFDDVAQRCVVEYTNNYVILNDIKKIFSNAGEAVTATESIAVFSCRQGVFPLIGNIYSFSVSRNGVLQLDLQPCLDPAGKPCMWDYVTRRPFYNQDTTGPDFLYG